MHALVKLAKEALREYIKTGCLIAPPEDLTEEMKERAGVFVCLKIKGDLRGCIGTFLPSTKNVATEIIRNVVSAAMEDPRFYPVQEDELGDIEFSVDVLSPPEKIADLKELDPKKYGVIVEAGGRRGLLLPDIEGVESVEAQLEIARRKACISPDEKIEIHKFSVIRYS